MSEGFSLEDIIQAARELNWDTPGPQARELCGKNLHDMSVHGRQRYKAMPDGTRVRNGRYCNACKRIKQRTPGAPERPNAQKPRRSKEEQLADPSRKKRGRSR